MADSRRSRPDADETEVQETSERKKKKKGKKKQAPSRWPWIAAYVGMGVVGLTTLAVVVWVAFQVAGGGPPAQPITAWEKFSTDESEFGFEHPAGWRAACYGLSGRREADVKGKSASITVKENLTGSIIGDIANAANAGQEVSDDRLPVAQVHDLRRPRDSRSYKEEGAVTVPTRFGKARRSAYVDGDKRGYRATVLMNQTALDVFCECRASDWETLRPAFERVIESIGPGGL